MRRIWIGIVVLLTLLGVGLLTMQITDRQLSEITETLKESSETDNWDQAVSLAQKAQEDWKEKWHMLAALVDHTDMGTVDGLFSQLEIYGQHNAETDHAATSAKLAEVICGIKENHRFCWWNLL